MISFLVETLSMFLKELGNINRNMVVELGIRKYLVIPFAVYNFFYSIGYSNQKEQLDIY